METSRLQGSQILHKGIAVEIRQGFVRKVYSILSCQLLLTVALAAPIVYVGKQWAVDHIWGYFISLALLMVVVCVTACNRELLRTFPWNYLLLLLLTGATSIMVGFASAMYTWKSVLLAAGMTCAVFICLTLYAWFTKTDFTGWGPYLYCCLSILVVGGWTLLIMRCFGIHMPWLMMLYDVCGVALFCTYMIYDTQCILGEWGGHQASFQIDDYCRAALLLYLDIIILFLHLLRLFDKRRE